MLSSYSATPSSLSDPEAAAAATGAITSPLSTRRLIGLTRAISDGQFSALILQMVVHPDWESKGVRGRLWTRLQTRFRGSGNFAVVSFPKPSERLFFWNQVRAVGDKKVLRILSSRW